MKRMRRRRAMLRPSVVLPLQLKPSSTRLSMLRYERSIAAERIVQTVSAELHAQGIGQHDGHHRLTHDARGRHDTHIAALDVRDAALARRVIDRWQRVD